MKTHSNLDSTYWHLYLKKIPPEKITQIIHEKTIEINKSNVHIDIFEPNSTNICKGNLMFIHGTSIYSRFYAEFCYEMANKGFRVIVPDMPGHGLSEGIRGHFTMNSVVSTLSEIVRYIQQQFSGKICMMGSSLGGISSLYAAAAQLPLDAIICHNAAVFSEEAYKHIVTVKGIFKLLLPFVPFLAKIFPKLKVSVLQYLPAEKLANNPRGFELFELFTKDPLLVEKYTLTTLRTQMKEAPANPIENITIPIMFINGEHDKLFTNNYMQYIFDRLQCKHKEFLIFHNQAHLIFQEDPQKIAEKITPFLEKHLVE